MSLQVVSNKIYTIDNKHPSAIVVEPGEMFVVQLQNAFGESFKNEEDFAKFMEDGERKKSLNHPCTGPIEIKVQEKNVSLAIQVVDTKIHRGYQCISQSTGFLKEKFNQRKCAVFNFQNSAVLNYNNDILIHTHPKIGFISTIDNEIRSPGRACQNGGNIDLNYLDKGSVIYLPVNNDTARLVVGDLHACQGNGEAAGIAIEADGEVTLKVDIVDKINFPVIRDSKRMIIVGWGDNMEAALKRSVENALEYLKRVFPFTHWNETEIYKFISAEGNLVLGNSTGKVVTCGMVFYVKRLLNNYEFPIFG